MAAVRLDLRRFFRWTGVFIIFVAAGLLAGGLRAFHEAGLWNGLQERAFDLSSLLPADGILGTLLTGLLGYQDSPTVGELASTSPSSFPPCSCSSLKADPCRPAGRRSRRGRVRDMRLNHSAFLLAVAVAADRVRAISARAPTTIRPSMS